MLHTVSVSGFDLEDLAFGAAFFAAFFWGVLDGGSGASLCEVSSPSLPGVEHSSGASSALLWGGAVGRWEAWLVFLAVLVIWGVDTP